MKAFVAVLVLGVALTGCSSKSTSSPSQPAAPTNSHAFNGGLIAGFHGNVSKKTSTFKFSLIPPVYAQTTTVSLSGTYSGYVSNVGNPSSVPAASPIYGVGSFFPPCAGQQGGAGGGCPSVPASGSMSPGQALASQANLTTAEIGTIAPAMVTGDGTLGPLVVYAYTFNQYAGPLDTTLFEVWVIRNGQVLNSGITCSIPVQTGAAGPASIQLQRCESSSTFAVKDRDGIIATVTFGQSGDGVIDMSFFLVKE